MRYAKYIRLYADQNGESHFEDLEIELAPMDFAPPAAPLNVAQFLPTARSYWVGFAADWHGETPHPTPAARYFVCWQRHMKSRPVTVQCVVSTWETCYCLSTPRVKAIRLVLSAIERV
jgi:hypothetical protein